MRTFYSEYVQHCMRFYARHTNPKFRSDADKKNWFACDSALKGFTDKEQEMLLTIYREEIRFPITSTTCPLRWRLNRIFFGSS